MMEMPSLTASSASASPTRTLRSSDSTTHGPAMRNGLLSEPNRVAMSVRQLGQLARRFGARVQLGVVDRRAEHSRAPRRGVPVGAPSARVVSVGGCAWEYPPAAPRKPANTGCGRMARDWTPGFIGPAVDY